jgi:hypothetical protein
MFLSVFQVISPHLQRNKNIAFRISVSEAVCIVQPTARSVVPLLPWQSPYFVLKPPFDYRVRKTVHTSLTYLKIQINIRNHSMPMSYKSSLYFMFSHRKFLFLPCVALHRF